MTPKQFVKKYGKYAKKIEKNTGLNAIAILSQAALETGWGKSCPGNMMFGVKAKKGTPLSDRQLLKTTEYFKTPDKKFPEIISVTRMFKNGKVIYKYRVRDWFMRYTTPYESFEAHAMMLKNSRRYADAWTVRGSAYSFFYEIYEAGYATDPDYPEKLIAISKLIAPYI